MKLKPGQLVERYVVQALLGEGGMAEVYRVRHKTLATSHALKILTIERADVADRLVEEGRTQATLRHPNVVAVTDVLRIQELPALLMEFVEGPSLETWLQNYRPSLDEALAVFHGIVAGVECAHDRGLIHRDLKPGNVMMHIEDGRVIPKVADFGLAKALEGGTKRTKAGQMMGTPAYMPPEQIRDASTCDERADVFALGCILYELVSGEQAFQGEHLFDVLTKVKDLDYVRIRERMPDLPTAVVEGIERTIVADRDLRCSSCADLRAILAGIDPAELEATLADGTPAVQRPARNAFPTILPDDSPGALAALSMVNFAPDTDAERDDGTWIAEIDEPEPEPEGSAPVSPTLLAPLDSLPPDPQQSSSKTTIAVLIGAALAIVVLLALTAAGAIVLLTNQTRGGTEELVEAQPSNESTEADPADNADSTGTSEDATAGATHATAGTEGTPDVSETQVGTEAPNVPVAPKVTKRPTTPTTVQTPPPKEPTTVTVPGTDAAEGPPGGVLVPPPVMQARLSLQGDAKKVRLRANGVEHDPEHPVPPGVYEVRAWFGTHKDVPAGSVTLSPGEVASLKCVSVMAQCIKR